MGRLILILILSSIVYFSNLGGYSIYILDEAKNAQCAVEMMQRHNLVIPTFNDKLRTDKPPLHYFFMITSYKIFSATPFAARFFSALSGVILAIFVYINVRKILNERAAFFSVLALLSSLQLTIQFHLAVPDPFLILLMTISLFSVFKGLHHDPKQFIWFYIASALAFMTKGLIAIVIPGLILGLYLILQKQMSWSLFQRLKILQGILIFSIIAFPWYIAVGYATDGVWLKGFFLEHNVSRYTNTMEGHGGFPFSPFVILLLALLPFSVFVVQATSLAYRTRKEHPFLLYALVTCFVFALFFSMSKTILPSYPAPAIPFFAIVLGCYLDYFVNHFGSISKSGVWAGAIVNVIIGLCICVLTYFTLSAEPQLDHLKNLAWFLLVIPVGMIGSLYYLLNSRPRRMIYLWSASWIITSILFFYVVYPPVDQLNPVSKSLSIIHTFPSHRVVGFRIFNPSYVFNLHKTIEQIDSREHINDLLGKEKITIITRSKYLPELPMEKLKIVYRGKDLFENNESVLLAN